MHRWVLCLSNHGTAVTAVFGHASALVPTTENRELDALETHQSLANIVVGCWVNCTALCVSEELVESVIGCTLSDFVVVVQLLSLIDSIVNGAISGVLRWASVKSGRGTSWVLLTVTSVGTKRAIWILISTGCGSKRLQISDDCEVVRIIVAMVGRRGLNTYVCHSVQGSPGRRGDLHG